MTLQRFYTFFYITVWYIKSHVYKLFNLLNDINNVNGYKY